MGSHRLNAGRSGAMPGMWPLGALLCLPVGVFTHDVASWDSSQLDMLPPRVAVVSSSLLMERQSIRVLTLDVVVCLGLLPSKAAAMAVASMSILMEQQFSVAPVGAHW